MKYYRLKSNVEGGHYINDLRLKIPSEKAVSVGYWKAKKSAELREAIQEGLVSVESVLHDSKQNVENSSPSPDKKSESLNDNEVETSTEMGTDGEDSNQSEEIEQLQKLNKRLLLTVQELVSQQKDLSEKQERLIEKMDEYMDSPRVQAGPSSFSEPKSSSQEVQDSFEPFVPKKIRTGQAQASGDLEMEEEGKKSSSSIDEAAEKMKELEKTED